MTERRQRQRIWLWSLAGAITFALLGVTQTYTSRRIEGLPVDLNVVFLREATNWFSWGLLAPAVVALGRRLSTLRLTRLRSAMVWVTGTFIGVLAHSVIEVIAARAIGVVPTPMPLATNIVARFSATIAPNVVVFGLIALAFTTVEHFRDTRAQELREADLQTQLAQAQLTMLRMQLQPHFLFNTLHAASSLMETNVAAARRVLVRLSDLLRLALATGNQHEVSLEEELAFLETYLDIQRIRFDGRLTIDVRVERAALTARVPSLFLQPLVENALRHGVERRAGPGFVRVNVSLLGDSLRIEVADNGPGLADTNRAQDNGTPDGTHGGVGLSNTRARLEQLYGTEQHLELGRAAEGGLAVRVMVPHRVLPAGTPPLPATGP